MSVSKYGLAQELSDKESTNYVCHVKDVLHAY